MPNIPLEGVVEPRPAPPPEVLPDPPFCVSCCTQQETTENRLVTISNGREAHPLCETCSEDTAIFAVCLHCGELIWQQGGLEWIGSDAFCLECHENHCWTCDYCAEPIYRDHEPQRNRFREDRADLTRWVCDGCVDDLYWCDNCERLVLDDNYYGYDRCIWCHEAEEEDAEEEDEDSRVIREFSYNPLYDLDFMGKPPGGLYLGVELEVDTDRCREDRGCLARRVLSQLGEDFAIAKHDGSINGFEIVSAPASLEIHRERWPRLFDNVPHNLRSWNGHQCGMHVHLSRKALSPLTVEKIRWFINNPEHEDFIDLMAGRGATHYARRASTVFCLTERNDRYQSVNNTNSPTVEVRIFRGTLKAATFFKNLEFCVALAEYAGSVPLPESFSRSSYGQSFPLSPQSFSKWMAQQGKRFPHLHAFLLKEGYISAALASRRAKELTATLYPDSLAAREELTV